jgi:hypothetical protein
MNELSGVTARADLCQRLTQALVTALRSFAHRNW